MCGKGVIRDGDGEHVRSCGVCLLKQDGGCLVFHSQVGDDLGLGLGESLNNKLE